MKIKGLTIGISLIFLGTCIVPTIAQMPDKQLILASGGKWWYVGGTGPGNYTVIQDAVDNASAGDTVYVYHGTYNQLPGIMQCVDISKSIHLIGEDKNTTIINGIRKWDVVTVGTNKVDISGFTIQNAGAGNNPGEAIHVYKPDGIGTIRDIKIHDNIIANNEAGMTMYNCFNTSYYDNIFREDGCGCFIDSSANCSIYHNLFINDTYGLDILYEGSIDVYENEFRENAEGVWYNTCIGMTIHSNNFINNTVQASFFKSGGFVDYRTLKTYVQNWSQNYWSDWNKTDSRPIRGQLRLYLGAIFGFGIPFNFRSYEYDQTPAQVPYQL